MPSILLKMGELGFTAHGCYREGDCESCRATHLLTWFWHQKWICDTCVLNHLLPEEEPHVPHGTISDYTDGSTRLTGVQASMEAA
jgi:hypothetical protein